MNKNCHRVFLRLALVSASVWILLAGCRNTSGPATAETDSTPPVQEDVPSVFIHTGVMDLGVNYHVEGTSITTSDTTEDKLATRTASDDRQEHNLFIHRTKLRFAASLKAGLLKGGVTLSGDVDSHFEDETTNEYESKSTFENKNEDIEKAHSLEEQKDTKKVSYGDHDGYIRTILIIENNSLHPITIKNISYVLETNPCGSGDSDSNSLGSGIIRTRDLEAGNIQGTGVADNRPAQNLEKTILGQKTQKESLLLPGLDTNLILTTVKEHRSVRLIINSFVVVSNGQETLMSNVEKSKGSVELDLEGPNGESSVHMLKPKIWDFGTMSVEDALRRISNASFSNHGDVRFIDEINGKKSDFFEPQQDGEAADVTKGRWVVIGNAKNWSKLQDPVPPGTTLVVVWMNEAELRGPTPIEFSIPSETGPPPESDLALGASRFTKGSLVPVACAGKVKQGDIVHLRISGKSISYQQKYKDLCPGPGKATQNYADEATQPLDGAIDPSVFNLFLSFDLANEQKKLIPLTRVVPICRYKAYADGQVELEFTITSDLLGEGETGKLCFVSPIGAKHDIFVGLWYNPKVLCGVDYQGRAMGSSQTFYDHNQLHLSGFVSRAR